MIKSLKIHSNNTTSDLITVKKTSNVPKIHKMAIYQDNLAMTAFLHGYLQEKISFKNVILEGTKQPSDYMSCFRKHIV